MLRSIIQKMRDKENDLWINGSAFLFGMLGTLTMLVLIHFIVPSQPKIGTVNVTGIVEQFIKQETSKNLPQDILKNEVSKFGLSLDKEIKVFSKQHNVVLFLYEAVISGDRDYTNEIKTIMQHHSENRDE